MTEGRPRPGKHAARHRAPNAFERTRNRTLDSVAAIGDLSLPRVATGGRVVAATAIGGALAATAVVGAQVANHSVIDVARASTDLDSSADQADDHDAAPDTGSPTPDGDERAPGNTVSRSAGRPSLDDLKKKAAKAEGKDAERSGAGVITKKAEVDVSDPRALAREMLSEYGWSEDQFGCLDALWIGESDWKVDADNPTSSAYGIPQALPGSKMASAGPDWATNPATQIKWGLGYIQDNYGSPCAAQSFKSGHNWY